MLNGEEEKKPAGSQTLVPVPANPQEHVPDHWKFAQFP